MCPATAETRPVVINARTDAYLVEALDGETIAREVKEIRAPVNMIAGPSIPPLAELEAIGESGVSLGPRSFRAASGLVKKMARELLDWGTYDLMSSDAMSYTEDNFMLEPESPTSISVGG